LMAVAPGFGWLLLTGAFFAGGLAIANPTVSGLCSKAVPEDRQGELFGILQSARSVGFVLGPLIGGALFDWRATAPYFLAGIVAGAPAGPTLLLKTDPSQVSKQEPMATSGG